jgi:hypothetical protein
MINPQMANPQIFTQTYTTLSQNRPERHLFKRFLLYTNFLQGGKVYSYGSAEVLSPQITKQVGLAIANPQRVIFAEGPQI